MLEKEEEAKRSLNPFFIRSVIQMDLNLKFFYKKLCLNPFFIRSVIQMNT